MRESENIHAIDTKFGLETIYDVVDGRYISGKPLIITTNRTFDELRKDVDMDKRRIYDRVLTMTRRLSLGGKTCETLKRKTSWLL